jgi:hypothetical protein
MRVKNSTLYAIVYFAVFFAVMSMVSCSSSQHGYDYKTHHRKSANAKPSKCYKKHNQW